MEAICKVDYEKRVKANKEAKEKLEEAKRLNRPIGKIRVPLIGFYAVYGVWFSGELVEYIRQVSRDKFAAEIGDSMHVYVDVDPNPKEDCGIKDGVHNITVYGRTCLLYKWMAQGFHRGLVVLMDDEDGNTDAEKYRQSGTWSWKLGD